MPQRMFRFAIAVCLLFNLLILLPHVAAAPIVVNSTADTNTSGTLRFAINQANTTLGMDSITFNIAPSGAQTIQLGSPLPAIIEDVTIDGTTQPVYAGTPLITVDGNGHGPVFSVTSGTVVITGLIIQNGTTAGSSGGGIFNQGTLRVQDSTITGNTANDSAGVGGEGGGIANTGTLTLANTTVSANHATTTFDSPLGGGGILNSAGGHVTLDGSTITGNTASFSGGGINNHGSGSVVTVQTGSVITANTAQTPGAGGGGGIYNYGGGQIVIDAGTIGSTGAKGNTAKSGGGVFNTGAGSSLIVRNNSSILGNTATGTGGDGGGGIYNDTDSTVTITNSTIGGPTAASANQATNGGGIYTLGSAATTIVTITGSTIASNTANGPYGGGGITIVSGAVNLTDSTVAGNHVSGTLGGDDGSGGGIANYDMLTLTRSTVSGNDATNYGGGLMNFTGTVQATNSTVSGNTAPAGGGIYNLGGSVALTFSTVFSSSATGIYNSDYDDGSTITPGQVTLTGTLLANSGGNCTNQIGNFVSANYNLSSDTSCNAALTGSGDLKGITPLLGTLANHGGTTQTHDLLTNSPAFDRAPATGAGCPATDQRNTARPIPTGGLCDIGAFEGAGVTPTVTSVTPNTGTVGVATPNVVIVGTNFRTGATILFGATPATNVVINSDTQITVSVPPSASAGVVNVMATNPGGPSGVKTNAFTYVVPPTITLVPATLPGAVAGVAYQQLLTASGGTAPYSFAITGGALPGGLSLNSTTGVLSGTPTTVGSATFTVTATDANTFSGAQQYTITVTAAPLVSITLTGVSASAVKVGQVSQFTATGSYADNSTLDITNQVQWSSDNPNVAMVGATTGKVTGVSPGTATITATMNGVTKSITVTIGAPTPIGIAPAPAPANRPGGTTSQPGAVPAPAPNPAPSGR